MTNEDINNYLRLAIMEEVNKRMGKNFECIYDLCDYAKNLEKENEQLKQKIERMKNHENCKHHSQYSRMHTIYADDKIICYKCKNYSLWELAE